MPAVLNEPKWKPSPSKTADSTEDLNADPGERRPAWVFPIGLPHSCSRGAHSSRGCAGRPNDQDADVGQCSLTVLKPMSRRNTPQLGL
jgi:hypothetical protein